MIVRCTYDKLVKIDELRPHPKNSNVHPPEQIARLADILKYQGWRYPVKVSKLSGFVTSGHGRIEAARKNGWIEVPVNYQEYESAAQEFADLTADNSIALWAELDLKKIETDFEEYKLELDHNLLGLEDFVIDELDDGLSGEDEEETDPEPPEEPEKLLGQIQIINSDCLEAMRAMPENSVDSIVTDPPYGFAFMGKKWDYEVPSIEIWREALRILKPGGHLLSFSGPRTYHRMAVNIEDAGFEVRDQLQWLFGSGFPKSLDISKAIDKAAGAEREVVGINEDYLRRKPNGMKTSGASSYNYSQTQYETDARVTAPTTDAAKQWDGWGTALKPANEPILLARKPLSEKTVAANVLKWGTGGINVDGCRVGTETITSVVNSNMRGGNFGASKPGETIAINTHQGRFPANLILDETAAEMLDAQSGNIKGSKATGLTQTKARSWKNTSIAGINRTGYEDQGGASRFFYVAKASKGERNTHCGDLPEGQTTGGGGLTECGDKFGSIKAKQSNTHPTVKPTSIMRYLCKMITPQEGIILDPFMGSGTTGVAALQLGFKFIGTEREAEYFKICEKRLNAAKNQTDIL